jgi:hypothetical protein
VRQQVAALLATVPSRYPAGQVPAWLAEPVAYVGLVLRRLGTGLYHCYDVPGLPRTDNALEQFYRQLKAGERQATGHRRSDAFVVRCGGYAAYAAAASTRSEPEFCAQLATVSLPAYQRARRDLRATYERQAKLHRFHLRPQRYLSDLSDLEARWAQRDMCGLPGPGQMSRKLRGEGPGSPPGNPRRSRELAAVADHVGLPRRGHQPVEQRAARGAQRAQHRLAHQVVGELIGCIPQPPSPPPMRPLREA